MVPGRPPPNWSGPEKRSAMKTKKSLAVATAVTGAVAGAGAFLPATAAHAVSGGWQIKVTLGGRIQWATVSGIDRQGNYITETASNYTGQVRYSIPFEQNGIKRTFIPSQSLVFRWGGSTAGPFSVRSCRVPNNSGTMIWSGAVKGFNC
jgi:hypothetical protein